MESSWPYRSHGTVEMEYEAEEGGLILCERNVDYQSLHPGTCDYYQITEVSILPGAFSYDGTFGVGSPWQYDQYTAVASSTFTRGYYPPCNWSETWSETFTLHVEDYLSEYWGDYVSVPYCFTFAIPAEVTMD